MKEGSRRHGQKKKEIRSVDLLRNDLLLNTKNKEDCSRYLFVAQEHESRGDDRLDDLGIQSLVQIANPEITGKGSKKKNALLFA